MAEPVSRPVPVPKARRSSVRTGLEPLETPGELSPTLAGADPSGKPLKVLCTGDRHWTDAEIVRSALSRLSEGTIIVHGDDGNAEATEGLDRMAGRAAQSLGLEVRPYPADWRRYGRPAGPIRNSQMLDSEHPDLVYAFHDKLFVSKGTRDMVSKALRAKITVVLFNHEFPLGMELKGVPMV